MMNFSMKRERIGPLEFGNFARKVDKVCLNPIASTHIEHNFGSLTGNPISLSEKGLFPVDSHFLQRLGDHKLL